MISPAHRAKVFHSSACKLLTFLVCGVSHFAIFSWTKLNRRRYEKDLSGGFSSVLVLTFILGSSRPAHSQFTWPPGCEQGSLPSHDPKNPADQLIVICIPSNWNGRLVIYAHGFVPPQAPLALPTDELTLTDGTFVPNLFLSLGFAFATSSFHKNGLAIEQGAEDLNRLLQYFRSVVPPRSLQKVFITGASEGGLIALLLLERFPGKYDAGFALCAPVGGSADFIKYAYDFRVVFDYFFPTVFTFPPDQPGEQPFGADRRSGECVFILGDRLHTANYRSVSG